MLCLHGREFILHVSPSNKPIKIVIEVDSKAVRFDAPRSVHILRAELMKRGTACPLSGDQITPADFGAGAEIS